MFLEGVISPTHGLYKYSNASKIKKGANVYKSNLIKLRKRKVRINKMIVD